MALTGWFMLPASRLPVVLAEDEVPEETEGPQRTTFIKVDIDLYEWWMTEWGKSEVLCQIVVEHEGMPTSAEMLNSCGQSLYDEWLETAGCGQSAAEDSSECEGMILHLAGKGRGQREMEVELPPAQVWVSVIGCQLQYPDNRCDSTPLLYLQGEEPLPNETIVSLQGTVDGRAFTCPGDHCTLPMPPTGLQGQTIEFWGDSSFGDSTEHFTARVRVIPWGDFADPEKKASADTQPAWFVDVLSSQWKGEHPASSAEIWQVFPEVGGPPAWLSTPKDLEDLRSSVSYYYLAGMLIQNGAVDASGCPDGGMQADKAATACGVQAALPQVQEWQNRFDAEIVQVARDTGVPAQLMKNIFSRESQFWPGIYKTYREAGLGQMTDYGADTLLLWNPSFFQQFCPLVLSEESCNTRFDAMSEQDQRLLRGALVQKFNAACPSCSGGIDLSQANFSVGLFAESLLAHCRQTAQIIMNTTQRYPGEVSSYADLWRFTLVNYNAGAGCLMDAVNATWGMSEPLDWEHVSARLGPVCQPAIGYVDQISQMPGAEPTPAPWQMQPTATPSVEPSAQPTEPTVTPGGVVITPTPTSTVEPEEPPEGDEEELPDEIEPEGGGDDDEYDPYE